MQMQCFQAPHEHYLLYRAKIFMHYMRYWAEICMFGWMIPKYAFLCKIGILHESSSSSTRTHHESPTVITWDPFTSRLRSDRKTEQNSFSSEIMTYFEDHDELYPPDQECNDLFFRKCGYFWSDHSSSNLPGVGPTSTSPISMSFGRQVIYIPKQKRVTGFCA